MKHIYYKIIKIIFIILMSVDMLTTLILRLPDISVQVAIIIYDNPILGFLDDIYWYGGFLIAVPISIVNIIFANVDLHSVKNSKDEVPSKIKKRCKTYLIVSLISLVIQIAGFIYVCGTFV